MMSTYCDFEAINEEIIQPDNSQSVLNLKSINECLDKVSSLLDGRNVLCVLVGSYLHISSLQVKSDLEL